MKRILLFLLPVFAISLTAHSQSRGVRIGYIDMEFILASVPDYAEAKNQLEQKAQKWKQEIETKRADITKLKDNLKTERVLLTKELIEEREEEIAFQEKELLDYQQQRFGPTGDLVTQKAVLIKPIQDQVFTAAQDIAEAKKYDFIFDKSSDLTMLFAAKKFDISEQVIRSLTRASRREQMSKKQIKEEAAKEAKEDMIDENPALAERQKVLDQKKADREKLVEERKLAAETRKQEAEARRAQLKAEKEAKKNGTTVAPATTTTTTDNKTATDKTSGMKTETAGKTATDSTQQDAKTKSAAARAKALEDRKKTADERRQKALDAREALKKAKEEEKLKATKPSDSVPALPKTN
ncbi:MAG: OmpH family outer membrane protein [Flavobacterium sp.]|uniref:OmpH family outer membrane protein n=1 Tax=Flavobacterium sp. TaxID=239 RepID=UPI00121A7F21|nr:OmpH family outer membrane protein [Flavobacterium sp.]RZJ63392.1 MAG: OmpH family outer membrane protein [Flavobacterium sp.]